MATYIKSTWRITWDPSGPSPLVLLDFGDRMEAEPELEQSHSAELVSFARADYQSGFHFGNIGHGATISRAVDYPTAADARANIIAHLATTSALRDTTLKIEIEDGSTYYLQDAVIQNVTPSISPYNGMLTHRVLWTYTIAGGALTTTI